ncbi:MAG: CAP domain-containing protein [Actinomycetes bacterium]
MRNGRTLRGLIVGTALLTAVVGFAPATNAGAANTAAASEFLSLTNSLRASRGLPSLQVDGTLTAKAQGWAQYMADTGVLAHSTLTAGLPGNWKRVGENVGRGGDVVTVHNAFVASAGHLKNLVDPGFTHVGIGVVDTPGGLYVAEVFMQTNAQPSAPAPTAAAPAPQTGSPRPVAAAPRTGGSTAAPSRSTVSTAPVAPPPPPPAPERLTAVLERLRALDG